MADPAIRNMTGESIYALSMTSSIQKAHKKGLKALDAIKGSPAVAKT